MRHGKPPTPSEREIVQNNATFILTEFVIWPHESRTAYAGRVDHALSTAVAVYCGVRRKVHHSYRNLARTLSKICYTIDQGPLGISDRLSCRDMLCSRYVARRVVDRGRVLTVALDHLTSDVSDARAMCLPTERHKVS